MVSETLTDSTPDGVETPARSSREGPRVAGIGRATVRGAVIGFLAMVVIVTGAALLAGVRVVSAIGIAPFAAGWVGLAMGAMFGASLYTDRIRDADQRMRLGRSSTSPTRWRRASGDTV
jgi:hypothetical protein